IDPDQRLMEAGDRVGVVRARLAIIGERDRIGYLARPSVHLRRAPERAHEIEEAAVELAHRRRTEIESLAPAARRGADDGMIDEIEHDLDAAPRAVRNH